MGRLKKTLIALVALVVLLVGVSAVAWWWLTTTRGGAEWVLKRSTGQVEQFEWHSLEGGLAGGIELRNVVFSEAGLRGEIGQLELAARVRLGRPLKVTVDWLRIREADIYLPPVPEPPPEPEPFELADYRSPVEVIVREFRLDAARIHPPEGEVLTIEHASFRGRYAERLALEELAVRMHPFELAGDIDLELSDPWTVDSSLTLDWAIAEEVRQRLVIRTAGPAAELESGIIATGPLTAEVTVRVLGLPDAGDLQAEVVVDGRLGDWPGVDGRVEDLSLSVSGGLEAWRLESDFELHWPDLPVASTEIRATGDLSRAELEQVLVSVLDGRIEARGRVALEPEPVADLTVTLLELDFTELYPEWPDQARLSGGLELAWDEVLAIRNLELRAPPSDLRVSGQADFDPATERLDVALDWEALTWPPVLDGAEPLFSSQSGRLRGSGSLSEWQAEIDALFETRELPPGSFHLEADGDRRAARIRSAGIDLGDAGRLQASGTVSWVDGPGADLELELAAFDPGYFVTELPGRIDAELAVQLDRLEPLSARLQIAGMEGELRGQLVSGQGGLAVTDAEIHQADLVLDVGANRLTVASEHGRAWEVELEAGRLDQLWPDVSGRVDLAASVELAEGRVEWTARGDSLAYLHLRLAEMQMSGKGRWREVPSVDLEARLVDLDLNPWERLDRVEIGLAGDCEAHALDFSMEGMRANLDFRASGRLPECLDDPATWEGRIESLSLTESLAGDWNLRSALPVSVTPAGIAAGPGCLEMVGEAGAVCLVALEMADVNRAALGLEAVPLDLLLLPADPVFSITSRVDGRLEVRWDEAGLESIDSRLVIGPGGLRGLDGLEDLLAIRQVEFLLESPVPRSLEGSFDAELEADSRITGRARIPDMRDLGDMELDARARLELPDLGVFNRLVPELDQLAGRVSGELSVTGPVADPELAGRLAISEGLVYYAPMGTRLEELNLELEADEARSTLTGSFRAGDGEARIDGQLWTGAGTNGWRAELAVSGDRLRLTDVDWAQVTASPDLRFGLRAERLDMNGEVVIERARLGMPPGTEDRVSESPDAVVVGEQEEELEEPLPMRDLAGTVKIRLGDDVRLSAAGLQTRLAGDLDLIWEPEQALPRGRGIIRLVDGSYRTYGQELRVDDGQVIFTGHPIDNPRLDIEAIRDIFGDPQVEHAGVRIRGSARNPRITVFSSPPTSEEKALAYVLTGADFDPAAGQGAFSVGFWVLPRLFVSYGLGLFDTGNMLAARYELTRRWGIRATSDERDTGADISYLLER